MATDVHVSPVGVPPQQTTQHASSVEAIVSSFEEADHQDADLSGHTFEDWLCLGLFWIMALLVFLQFFTRYVLNDSFAWTEELATYSLIGVVFIGAAMCVRTSRHIQVDLLYRFLPHVLGRVLSTLIDVARTAFFAYVCWLVWRYIQLVGDEPMTTIEWNKSYVYWLALFGFALMAIRSLQVTIVNWRQGYSNLERPEAYDKLD
ncbi:TRAP transporter small permease [Bordetella sputigena]|uniref:TRAP transporter small permease n=1 Tax=Bordetella sputigena TaxID=1416810 RepID=UPI0039EE05BA